MNADNKATLALIQENLKAHELLRRWYDNEHALAAAYGVAQAAEPGSLIADTREWLAHWENEGTS